VVENGAFNLSIAVSPRNLAQGCKRFS
jgi:hypothetical protein